MGLSSDDAWKTGRDMVGIKDEGDSAGNTRRPLDSDTCTRGINMPFEHDIGDSADKFKCNEVSAARAGSPTPAFLRAIIKYDPYAGRFFWRERTAMMFAGPDAETRARQWNTRYAGEETFLARDTRGYAQAAIYNKQFLGHRVAWAIFYGRWPLLEIDHIDRVRDNNRILNLRDVTRSENLRNRGKNTTPENWKSIGELARALAEKAVRK